MKSCNVAIQTSLAVLFISKDFEKGNVTLGCFATSDNFLAELLDRYIYFTGSSK